MRAGLCVALGQFFEIVFHASEADAQLFQLSPELTALLHEFLNVLLSALCQVLGTSISGAPAAAGPVAHVFGEMQELLTQLFRLLLQPLAPLVEVALATRAAQPSEATEYAAGWHGVRAVLVGAPRYLPVSRVARLKEAIPELFAPPLSDYERSLPTFVRSMKNAQADFEAELVATLELRSVEMAGDALSQALVEAPAGAGAAVARGTCTCGRAALILRRCAACTRGDLAQMPPHPWQGRPLGAEPLEDPDAADEADYQWDEVLPLAAVGPAAAEPTFDVLGDDVVRTCKPARFMEL